MLPLDVTSHNLTLQSSAPEAIRRVSGEKFADLTQLLCAFIENMNLRSCNCVTLSVLSSEPDKISDPSCDRATERTPLVWALIT